LKNKRSDPNQYKSSQPLCIKKNLIDLRKISKTLSSLLLTNIILLFHFALNLNQQISYNIFIADWNDDQIVKMIKANLCLNQSILVQELLLFQLFLNEKKKLKEWDENKLFDMQCSLKNLKIDLLERIILGSNFLLLTKMNIWEMNFYEVWLMNAQCL